MALPDTRPAQPNAPAPTRVLHLVNGDLFAGAERVQDLLALNLPPLGYELGFVALKAGLFADKRRSQDVPLQTLAMRSRVDLRGVRRVADIVREGGYRLIHTHTPRSALVGRLAAAWSGVPMVHHVHSPTSRDTQHRWRNAVNVWAERLSLWRVAALVPVSRSLERYLLDDGYPAARVHPVFNGVPGPAQLAERAPPGPSWVLGAVALFRPRKGLEVLLHALADLQAKGLPVRLRAVGPFESDTYRASIMALCQQLGVDGLVDWVGFSDDVPGQLRQMDAFVLPSLYGEGMPMVVLEAMAQGVPVVATRVEGVPEVLTHGTDGLLVQPGDAADLAAALVALIQARHDWAAMRQAAHARQQALFSERSMAAGVARVYDHVLQAGARP